MPDTQNTGLTVKDCPYGHQMLSVGGCRLNIATNERMIFEGAGGVEAEDFVFVIKLLAADQGKLGDDQYVAQLASQCFARSALRWYTNLAPEVQDSWRQLSKAILATWMTTESEIAQSRLSLAPFRLDKFIEPPKQSSRRGIIRVLKQTGSEFVGYVGRKHIAAGLTMITNKEEALTVSYDPTSSRLSVTDPTMGNFECLGIFPGNFTETPTAPDSWCYLSAMKGSGSSIERPQECTFSSQTARTDVWIVSKDSRQIHAAWTPKSAGSPQSGGFFVNASSKPILLAPNDGYLAIYAPPTYYAAILELEEIQK